jgi:mono/diheme cytochrome c family protein
MSGRDKLSGRNWKRICLVGAALLATACQSLAQSEGARDDAKRGLAYAQGSCGGCHAVERYGDSPNVNAPPFAGIVNQDGLTKETLSWWLRDAHNYPAEMEFYLEPDEVEELVAHMLSLRDQNYRPAI